MWKFLQVLPSLEFFPSHPCAANGIVKDSIPLFPHELNESVYTETHNRHKFELQSLKVGCLWVTRDHPNQLYLAYQGRNLQDRALSNREGWKKFRKDSDDACHLYFTQCFTSPAARWCPLTTYMPMSMWTTYHGLRPDYNHHPPGNIQ